MDGHLGLRPGRAADPDRRGRLRPLPLGPEGRARRRRRRSSKGPAARSRPTTASRSSTPSRTPSTPARSSRYAQGFALMDAMARESKWEINNGGSRPDVARRLHHPQRLPRQDQGGVRPQPQAGEPAARPVLPRRDRPLPARLAAGGRPRPSTHGIPLPAMTSALAYLRRLPLRPAARQPAPGPARLLRRPHLRARRPAPRPVLPHQLDRPRRHHRKYYV